MIQNDVMYRLFAPGVDDPTNVSNAVLFPASDGARHRTDIALPADAGAMLR